LPIAQKDDFSGQMEGSGGYLSSYEKVVGPYEV